jgi:hypothetical protein
MFSQSMIDDMSIDELVQTIKSMVNEVHNRLDDHVDALDYTYAVSFLTDNLKDRLCAYIED